MPRRRVIAIAAKLALAASFCSAIASAYDPGRGAELDPAHPVAPVLQAASQQTGLLRVILGLALAFTLAIAAAHPLVRRVERRLGLTVLLSSGLPFLALGVVFRLPAVGILTDEVVDDLRPALEFGIGWLGFLVGLQFDVRELDRVPDKTGAVVVAESAVPVLTTAIACSTVLLALEPGWSLKAFPSVRAALYDFTTHAPLRDAIALGACAAQAAPVAAVAIARSSGSVGAKILEHVTRLDDVASALLLALVCAFFRPTDAYATWKLPHIAWVFIELGMGGVLGILTYVLVRGAKSAAEEIACLLGAIALSAGMSGYLGISPLVTCAIAGALLTNLPMKHSARLKETMTTVERPLYMIFLVVAGALWNPMAWQGWVLVPVFVFARVGGKLIGAHLAKRVGPDELPDAATLGLALAPQSPIAIATIVSYVTLYRAQTELAGNFPFLMTAVIGGGVLTELTVQILVRLRGGLRFDMRDPSMVSILPPGEIGASMSSIPPPVSRPPSSESP